MGDKLSVLIATQPVGATQPIATSAPSLYQAVGVCLLPSFIPSPSRLKQSRPLGSVLGFYNVFLSSNRSTSEGFQPRVPFFARVRNAMKFTNAIRPSLFSQKSCGAKGPSPKRNGRRAVCDSKRLLLVVPEPSCNA